MIEEVFICKQKFLGKCKKDCTPDFDTNHYPNNYDCSDFKGTIKTYQFKVKQK